MFLETEIYCVDKSIVPLHLILPFFFSAIWIGIPLEHGFKREFQNKWEAS
jgi:hypothetical protein